MPRGGHFIIPGGDEGIISLRFITWQNLRMRANRRTPVRLFAAVRTLAPGFESTLSNTIKNTPAGRDFLLWRGLIDDFRTIYRPEIQKLAANWDFVLPVTA